MKYWCGSPPSECDLCNVKIDKVFIDGATTMGPWANMCPACHMKMGRGIGQGRGQSYEKQADGRFGKTGG